MKKQRIDTIRLKLLKVAAKVVHSARYTVFKLCSSCPYKKAYLDVFLTKQCNKSIKTRESYRDALTVFKRFVESTGRTILNFRYSDCTYEYLLDFKDYMNTKPVPVMVSMNLTHYYG